MAEQEEELEYEKVGTLGPVIGVDSSKVQPRRANDSGVACLTSGIGFVQCSVSKKCLVSLTSQQQHHGEQSTADRVDTWRWHRP